MSRPLRKTLADLQVRPSRSMGQNFLQDESVAARIVAAAGIGPKDTVVEVGPGTGALTRHLHGLGARLILIEKDRRLAAELAVSAPPGTEVLEADAMEVDRRRFFPLAPLRLLGNLPYSTGTAILSEWLSDPSPVTSAVFMLQREVCERLAAAPRSKAYGQLSVLTQARWQVRLLFEVPPEAFHPRPKVTSAVVRLDPRPAGSLAPHDPATFQRLVRMGFSQRRKQLKNLLPEPPGGWEPLCRSLEIAPTARAEELSLPQWADLARVWRPVAADGQSQDELFDVVDEEDQVVGQARRQDVHAGGLRHRAVHVFVFTARGELLLQRRSHLKDVCPGVWDSSCAGHLDAGESYEACALRELQEELGLRPPEPPRLVARISACAETGMEFVRLFVTRAGGRISFPPEEIDCVHAFPLPVVDEWTRRRPEDFAPGFLKCWEAFAASPSAAAFPAAGPE